jgi:Bacterial Ig-like domain
MTRITRSRIAAAAVATLAISFGGPAANAYWQTLGSNPGTAKADAIGTMAAPMASASAGAAAVSWAPGTTAGGKAVSGYTVSRYPTATGGTKVAAGPGCAGTVTALSCTETGLPSGTWYYTVTPMLGSWAGPESARSGGVVVADTKAPDAPVFDLVKPVNIASTSIVSVGGTAEANSSVTVTVKDSVTPQHSASKTVPVDGSGRWTVTNFNLSGLTDGVITYAATVRDAAGNVSAAASVVSAKDMVAPKVTAVALSNVQGTQAIPDAGDKVTITFSEPLLPATICGTSTTPSGSLTMSGTLAIARGVNDVNSMTFASTDPACPSVNYGTVAINGTYTNGADLTFSSVLAWSPGTSQLTVTLGTLTGGSPVTKNGNVTPTYTPATGLTDAAGNPLPVTPVQGSPSRF